MQVWWDLSVSRYQSLYLLNEWNISATSEQQQFVLFISLSFWSLSCSVEHIQWLWQQLRPNWPTSDCLSDLMTALSRLLLLLQGDCEWSRHRKQGVYFFRTPWESSGDGRAAVSYNFTFEPSLGDIKMDFNIESQWCGATTDSDSEHCSALYSTPGLQASVLRDFCLHDINIWQIVM